MNIEELLPLAGHVHKDLLRLLIGKKIGGGASRQVYELRNNPELVLKIEDGSYDFGNIHESELWDNVSHTKYAKWLAPVHAISPCGTCLLMARTEPVAKSQLPKFVPEWLTDLKQENWGLYKGRVVCHDYGFSLAISTGLTNKVRRADWPHLYE